MPIIIKILTGITIAMMKSIMILIITITILTTQPVSGFRLLASSRAETRDIDPQTS